ncbi:MFS transporter [Streptomyces sp. NPDC002537]
MKRPAAGGWRARLVHERPRPRRVRESRYAWQLAVTTVCFGAFMSQLDASIVTLIYPSLEREFHEPLATVQWVSLAYLLVLTALLVTVGHLSDVLGRKLVYLYGFGFFTAASAACSLAPNLTVLVCCRGAQALGAAMLAANSVALVTLAAPRDRLRGALGLQAGGQALGLAAGPTLGGILVSTVGWRWVFWINVPVGVAAIVVGRYLLPRTVERADGTRFDLPGTAWLAAAVTALLAGVSVFSGLPLPGWAGAALIASSMGAFAAFVRREARAPAPLVSLELLRDKRIGWGLMGALAGYLVLFGPLLLVPLVLTRDGAGEMRAGLLLSALAAGFACAANLQEKLLPERWTSRRRCLVGAAVSLAGLAGLALACPVLPWLIGWLAVLGLGLGTFTPSNNAMVMGAVPRELSGTGGGMINMVRALGTALGIALVSLTFHLDGDRTRGSVLPPLPLAALACVTALMGLSVVLGGRSAPAPQAVR